MNFRGRIYDYGGSGERDGIVAYMKQWSRQPSEEKRTKQEIDYGMDR